MTSTLPIQEPSLRNTPRANADMPMASAFARTLRTFAEREQLDLTQTVFSSMEVEELPKKKELRPRAVGSPLTPGGSLARKVEAQPEEAVKPAQPVEPVEAPKAPAQPLSNGLLSRGWTWLKKNNKFTVTKQMRVAETISLGEKRFVSVIHVDGQKFLIGGGAQGVTLLTQLGTTQATADALQTIANAGEQLK
jgi:hypothetical protein